MSTLWTTQTLKHRGITHQRIKTACKNGKLFRIFRGHYLDSTPTPQRILDMLRSLKPHSRIAGKTALEMQANEPLTFPIILEVPRNKARMKCQYFEIFETRCTNFRRQPNALAALERPHPSHNATHHVRYLEQAYRGKDGGRRLAQDKQHISHKPPQMMRALAEAQIGCDSRTERIFFRAAAHHGIHFEHNARIGPYRFDGVNHKHKLIIEIDGENFHRHDPLQTESHQTYERDRWKDITAAFHGYRVFRFTSDIIDRYLATAVGVVRAYVRGEAWPRAIKEAIWEWKQYDCDMWGEADKV